MSRNVKFTLQEGYFKTSKIVALHRYNFKLLQIISNSHNLASFNLTHNTYIIPQIDKINILGLLSTTNERYFLSRLLNKHLELGPFSRTTSAGGKNINFLFAYKEILAHSLGTARFSRQNIVPTAIPWTKFKAYCRCKLVNTEVSWLCIFTRWWQCSCFPRETLKSV